LEGHRDAEAILLCREILAVRSDHVDALATAAYAYQRTGQLDDAIVLYQALADLREGPVATRRPPSVDDDDPSDPGGWLARRRIRLNVFGRIALCGLISAYNATEAPAGPKNIRAVLTQRLKMQGLIVTDWASRVPEAITQLGQWHKEGKLKIREDVREGGIDAFPDVLNLLYTSGNFGKLVLKV